METRLLILLQVAMLSMMERPRMEYQALLVAHNFTDGSFKQGLLLMQMFSRWP